MIVEEKRKKTVSLKQTVEFSSKKALFKSKTDIGVLVVISKRDTGKILYLNCFDLASHNLKKTFLSNALLNRSVLRISVAEEYLVSSAQVEDRKKGALCAGDYIVSTAGPDPDKTLYENISANILHELSSESFYNVRTYMRDNNFKWLFSYN